MKFEITVTNRREVVDRLEALTGERATYTRAPRFAYLLGGIAVEKDNTITTEENADMTLVQTLAAEGFIRAEDEFSEACVENPVENTEETVENLAGSVENGGENPDIPTECEETAETEQAEENEPTEETDAEPAEENEEMTITEAPNDEESDPTESEEDLEADDSYDDMVERIDAVRPIVSFPLRGHRPESVCNLVYTLYSRGALISKATGGKFDATEDLVEALRAEDFLHIHEVLEVIGEAGHGALKGLRFTEDQVIFDGFRETDVKEEIKAWTELFAAINKTAISQYHVRARRVEEANEKFAFRTWLTRMGMNGAELKAERNLLYKNLNGHTAFRTAADEKKWKSRQAAKRQELQERKAAAASAT